MTPGKPPAGFAVFATTTLAVGLCAQVAQAEPRAEFTAQAQHAAITQGSQVTDTLGADSGGFFLDHGRVVVNVLNDTAAQKVEAAGLTAKKVKNSFAALTTTKNTLDGLSAVPHTAGGTDTRTNQVVVKIYSAATPATADKVTAAAGQLGESVRVEHKTGKLELYIADGDAIQTSSGRCSLGFNVPRGGSPFLLTAGHCTNLGGTWSGGDVSGAQVVESDCPGADSGLLTRPNGTGPGEINTGQAITSAGTPTVGEQMQKQGSTTGGGSGEVTSVDEA